jgi:hypothetical protein
LIHLDKIWISFHLDNSSCIHSCECFISNSNSGSYWKRYENRSQFFEWLAKAIDPSITISGLKQLHLVNPPPIPDEPDSYYSVIKQKIYNATHILMPNVLDIKSYEGKALNQIPINVERDGFLVPCHIGNLILYPRFRGTNVFVKSENLFPQFTGYYFAFELLGVSRNLVSEVCYVSRDYVWKIYSKTEPLFIQNIINLMKFKIDSNNPPPSLNYIYKPQNDMHHLIDGETIWEAMIGACLEEDVNPLNMNGISLRGIETFVLNILQNPKISLENKNKELLHLFDGYCPGFIWSKLNNILKKFSISSEVEAKIQEAKKLIFVWLNIYRIKNKVDEMLKFPEIDQYYKSSEYQKDA